MSLQTASATCREVLKSHESLRLEAYYCPANKCTIGWGHTKTAKPNMKIDLAKAQQLFDRDVFETEIHVINNVKVPLNQNQFDALVSFVYNVGPRNFIESTLLQKVNQKDFQGAANQFQFWDNARDPKTKKLVEMPGLVKRRIYERDLFLKSVK